MASYVVLCNFTDQGIRNVKESVHRAEAEAALKPAATLAVAATPAEEELAQPE